MNIRKIILIPLLSLISIASLQGNPNIIEIATADFPPFRIVSGEGIVTGCDADIARDVFQRMGYRVQFRPLPLERAILGLKEGSLSAFITLTRNPEREQYLIFTDPVSTVNDVFFKRKDDAITWRDLTDLKNHRIGVSNYNYAPEFTEALKHYSLVDRVTDKSPELIHFNKLAAGRIDLFIAEVNVGRWLRRMHSPRFDGIDYIPRPIGPVRPFCLVFSRHHPQADTYPALIARFNRELKKYTAEGKRTAVFSRYDIDINPALLR